MTTLLYLLIAALAFFIIGYLLAKLGCNTGGERYLAQTPVDPVTEDDGSCEDTSILKLQAEEAAAAEAEAQAAQREAEEAKAAEEAAQKAAEEAAAKAEAEEAAKEAETKAAEEAKEEASVSEETAKATTQAEAEGASESSTEEASTQSTEPLALKSEASAKQDEPLESAEITAERTAEQSQETEEIEEPQGIAPEGLLDAPRNGKKDNLTRIKGIGVKIDAALNAIGIYHFDQIAVWTEENMAWADRELAFPGRAKRDDWVGQAKLLAAGQETEFSKRVDEGKVSSSKKA